MRLTPIALILGGLMSTATPAMAGAHDGEGTRDWHYFYDSGPTQPSYRYQYTRFDNAPSAPGNYYEYVHTTYPAPPARYGMSYAPAPPPPALGAPPQVAGATVPSGPGVTTTTVVGVPQGYRTYEGTRDVPRPGVATAITVWSD